MFNPKQNNDIVSPLHHEHHLYKLEFIDDSNLLLILQVNAVWSHITWKFLPMRKHFFEVLNIPAAFTPQYMMVVENRIIQIITSVRDQILKSSEYYLFKT